MSGLDNVSVFFPPELTKTGRKVPIDQYTLEVEVIGHVPGAERAKKQKKQVITWPECLDLLLPDEKDELIRDTLIRVARADTEKTAVAKEM